MEVQRNGKALLSHIGFANMLSKLMGELPVHMVTDQLRDQTKGIIQLVEAMKQQQQDKNVVDPSSLDYNELKKKLYQASKKSNEKEAQNTLYNNEVLEAEKKLEEAKEKRLKSEEALVEARKSETKYMDIMAAKYPRGDPLGGGQTRDLKQMLPGISQMDTEEDLHMQDFCRDDDSDTDME